MKKKDSNPANGHAHNTNNILYKLIAQNYERKNVDSPMISTFNNFLFNLADAFAKSNVAATNPDTLKLAVELIIAFQSNLAEEFTRHTCSLEEIVNFFANLLLLVEKIAASWNDNEKLVHSQVLNVLWFLLEQKAEEMKLPAFDKRFEVLGSLIQSYENYKADRLNLDFLIRESYTFICSTPDNKHQLSNMFVSYLRQPHCMDSFKILIQKYLSQCLVSNHVSNFKKALTIYQHFGSTFEERRVCLQTQALKILESNYNFTFIVEINQLYSFSKLFASQTSLRAIVKTIEKVIEKPNANAQTTKILEEISQLCLSEIEESAFENLDLKLQSFLGRIIDWVISRSLKKDGEEGEGKEKANLEPQGKEEKLIEFVKKLSTRNNDPESLELQKVCNAFSKILKKFITNPRFRTRLSTITLDSFPCLKGERIASEIVRQFILDVIPSLLVHFNLNIKDKSPMTLAIVLKRAEMQAQSLNGNSITVLQDYFNQSYYQMLHSESLNYHFMLCFIFLKYLPEKEVLVDLLIDELLKDLSKEGKNKDNRNLIINMALLLRTLYAVSNFLPIKFKVRQVIRNTELLSQKLDVSQIIIVVSKQLGLSKGYKYPTLQRCIDIQTKINEQLNNYNKDNVTLFYSLIIGISDIIENSENCMQNKSELLLDIKFVRRINFLSEVYTLIRCFIENITEWKENRILEKKKPSIFSILSKLSLEIKTKTVLEPLEDLNTFIIKLKEYLLDHSGQASFKLLSTLDHFKNNKTQYREDKFAESQSSKNFIKFYSQSVQDQYVTHVIMMRLGLKLLRLSMQAKNLSFSDLQTQIKTLFLVYLYEESPSDLMLTDRHELLLKNYILLLLLSHKIEQKENLSPLLEKLQANLPIVKQLTLIKHQSNYIGEFKSKSPLNIIDLCMKAILKVFSSFEKQDAELFRFVIAFIEEDKKDNCYCLNNIIKQRLQVELQHDITDLIVNRVRIGLELNEKEKSEFLEDSCSLYSLLGKALQKGQLVKLMQDIVQIDYYSDCDRSAFLLKEIANIFSVLQQKSPVCDTIFNYIITLAEIFPGQQKLQISNFICNFFGLATNKQEENLQGLEKNVSLQCNNQHNYKCLKCDEKRLFCLACSVTCHKDHPVCFISIPPEIKITRCQCREIVNCCHFSKENPIQNKNLPKAVPKNEFPPSINHYVPSYLSGPNREFMDRMKYGAPRQIPEDPFSSQSRFQYNHYIQEEEFDRMEHDLLGNRFTDPLIKDEFAPRVGSRLDRLFDRDEFPPNAYRIQMDHNRSPAQINPFLREKQREKDPYKEEQGDTVEPDFVDEEYENKEMKMELEESSIIEDNDGILKKYALLPKFIDLMINFCTKKAVKDKHVSNLQLWSPVFNNPVVLRMMQVTLKVANPGTFHIQVRRENPLNNVSCVLIKRNMCFNNRFLIIASGTELQVFLKEKLLILASEGKVQGFNPIHKHSVNYQVHSIEFNPTDKSSFCASGLHNLAMFTISNDGGIGRTQSRYNVNNLYINKIKLTKMGIFVGVEKEIRVLNYTCKHFLTIKAQETNTLIRQWSIYEKAAGCQLYFVCPNGNIFFTDILPSDEGKKEFTGRVNDQRKSKSSTGASVFIKDLPDIGKQIFASFKDGYNILGHLEGDQMENMTDIRLKALKVDRNIFDTFFIVGHVDIVKLPQVDEVYVVCTVKKYFPPEMAFHQGFLALIRLKKDGTTEVQVLNDESTCEFFQVFYIGNRHFFILSLHTDGSLVLNSPTKIPKAIVEEELKKNRENEQNAVGSSNQALPDIIEKTRKSLEKQLKLDQIRTTNISSSYLFRENTENFKLGIDYILVKLDENNYELKQLTFGKLITGISLPYFGNVQLPTRSISNAFQIGFTNSQALYFFAQGGFHFKYYKNDLSKFTRESINLANNRILEKIQRIERLNEYSEHERLINSSMMNNFLNIKEDLNQDFIFVARSFQNFKSKIVKFDQYFSIDTDEESSSIEKTALIIKMFLTRGLKEGNFCQKNFILELVSSLKSIVADVNRKLFVLLKEIIVLSMKVYEKQTGKIMNLYTEENYGLRAATESRVQHFYTLLKLDIGDEELNELLELLSQIIDEDLDLFAYYCSKYPGILSQLHRRLKRADTEERASALVKIYTLGYPVLCYCEIPCVWILSSVSQTVYAFINNKGVRESLYAALSCTKLLNLEPALKGLGNNENEVEDMQLLKNMQQGLMQEEAPKDPMGQIYLMFSRGQIDEDAMLRMIQDATKLEYEKEQEINQRPAQENLNVQPQLQLQMEENISEVDNQLAFVFDIIQQCTQNFDGDLDTILSRIVTLYVVAKAVDKHFQNLIDHLLERILKLVSEIDLKSQNQKLCAVLSYSCLFNRIIVSSQTIKLNGFKQYSRYQKIENEVYSKLTKIEFERVQKIKNPINFLPRIFRGEKPTPSAHVAYALANLLLYPCEPSHVLLSLECYWLLPNDRASYSKQKCESSIRDGINSGNLAKVYEIAKQNPEIWQQSDEYLEFIEKWIEEKRINWELALELLAIYYQN